MEATWERSLQRFLESWPPGLHRDFDAYWQERTGSGAAGGAPVSSPGPPYWLALPGWLASRYAGLLSRMHPGGDELLEDILWGGYALFIAVRIQDDLFDRQAEAPPLIFAPDLFLAEAGRCYIRRCGGLPLFWDFYRTSIAATVGAILDVESAQRAGVCPPGVLLQKYAEVNSIFKVGSAALCLLADEFGPFPHVSGFCDEIAMVSQIYDDIEDVTDDLAAGRLNYFARTMGLSVTDRIDTTGLARKMESWLQRESEITALVSGMRRRIESAEEAIAPLELPGVAAYCESERRTVDVLERVLRTSSADTLRERVFHRGGIASLLSGSATPAWTA